jgi:hypothetical protein
MDIALWEKWRDLDKRTMYVSAATLLACEVLGELKTLSHPANMVELLPDRGRENPPVLVPFAEIFPQLVPSRPPSGSPPGSFNVAGRTGLGREPCFFPSSIGSNKAGKHPTDIYVDDPSNERNSTTPVQREKVIHSFKQLEPILRDPNGNIRHIGTPWAFWDISAWIADHPEWAQYRFGCWDGVNPDTGIADGQGPGPKGGWPLAPNYMTADELYEEEARVDDPEFWAQQYLVKPVAAAYAMFTDERLKAASLTPKELQPSDLPPGQKLILWDPTSRADAQAGDWNGIILIHVTTAEHCIAHGLSVPGLADLPPQTNLFFPVFATEIRGQLGECFEIIENLAHEHVADLKAVWVEDTGACGAIKAWLHQKHWFRDNGLKFFPAKVGTRASKAQRLQGIQLALQEHRILFPPNFPGREILLKRLSEFPKSESDDLPDALALLTNYAMREGAVPGLEKPPQNIRYGPESVYWTPPGHKLNTRKKPRR